MLVLRVDSLVVLVPPAVLVVPMEDQPLLVAAAAP